MRKIFLLFAAILLLSLVSANAQIITWYIGSPDTLAVTATLNVDDSTLIISGTGDMIVDFRGMSTEWFHNPWEPYKDQIKVGIIEEGVTNIGRFTFMNSSNLKSVSIPSTVKIVHWYAFYHCYNLLSLTIPEGVETIKEEAFIACCSLTSIHIPSSIISIGTAAFSQCTNLTEITVSVSNNYYLSENGILFDKQKTTIIQYPLGKQLDSYVIPDGVTDIPSGVFANCINLKSISIPNSVTKISMGSYDNGSFMNCTGLTSISIPENVDTIGNFAFSGCTGLTSIIIPENVKELGYRTFGISTLKSIGNLSAIPQRNIANPAGGTHEIFEGVNRTTCILYVPFGSKESYRNSVYDWNEFVNIVEFSGTLPHYQAYISSYSNTMTFTASIILNNIELQSDTIEIGAFNGDECRGSILLQNYPEVTAHPYLGFLTVHGNNSDEITFKVYNHETKKEYVASNTPVTFIADAIYGNPDEPYSITITDFITQTIPLNNGWTWISTNVKNEEDSLLSQFKQNIGSSGILLKDKNAFIQAPYWIGTLSEINNTEMYMVNTSAESTLSFAGLPVDPTTIYIPLQIGWNWIGYTPQNPLSIDESLVSLSPQEGDLVKSYSAYSTYTTADGWIGDLQTLQPGDGYKYFSQSAQVLLYPVSSEGSTKKMQICSSNDIQQKWVVDSYRYSNNMTVTSIVLLDSLDWKNDQLEIGAFCGEECRGSVLLSNYMQAESQALGFLVIYGEENDEIQMKVYDHDTQQEYTVKNKLTFTSDAIYGSPSSPYQVLIFSTTGINNMQNVNLNVYPNPVNDILKINSEETIMTIELTNILGKVLLHKHVNERSTEMYMGSYQSGYYLLHIVTKNGKEIVSKIVKH